MVHHTMSILNGSLLEKENRYAKAVFRKEKKKKTLAKALF